MDQDWSSGCSLHRAPCPIRHLHVLTRTAGDPIIRLRQLIIYYWSRLVDLELERAPLRQLGELKPNDLQE